MIEDLYARYRTNGGKVSTDTRNLVPGSLFFALKGGNFDGNKFADKALAEGCAVAVVDDPAVATTDAHFLVEDVLAALTALAKHHRLQLNIPVIGITGSNGKTTTKELMNAVLSSTFTTFATHGNLNNHIGVPLSLLAIEESVEIAIIEMGANHVGEIRDLCAISQPDFGLITNIGKAHIEGFGSFDNVIKAKSELYDYIRATGGTIFLNNDNALLVHASQGLQSVKYGTTDTCEVHGTLNAANPLLACSWSTAASASEVVVTQLIGGYNFENVLAAIAVGHYFGVLPEAINASIASYTPQNNRSQIKKSARNTLLLDAYNANPASMTAALQNFSELEVTSKFVILGDMLELGDTSKEEHRQIIANLKTLGLTNGVLVGAEFCEVAGDVLPAFATTAEAIAHVKALGLTGQTILLKGSRGIKLETMEEVL